MFVAYLIAVVALVICVVFSLILGAALAYVYTKLKALGKSTHTHACIRFILRLAVFFCAHVRYMYVDILTARVLSIFYRYFVSIA